MRARLILPLCLALLLTASAARAANVTVNITGIAFLPKTVTIQAGDTVTWVNNDAGTHNVVADDGSFTSGPPAPSFTFSHAFTTAGTFNYHCAPHRSFGMTGTVIVQAGATPAAPSTLRAEAQSTTEILLTWSDLSGNETGFRIERKTLGGTYQEVGTVGANVTSFVVGGLQPATGYSFRVRAQNASGNSPFSGEAEAATNATPMPCIASATTLCVNNGRFQIDLDWKTPDGNTGQGQAVPVPTAPDSGLFYFFSPANLEMLIKVLNGCGVNNRYWVFFAATTNVEFTATVIDTQNGRVKVYFNPQGRPAPPVQDTEAFPACP